MKTSELKNWLEEHAFDFYENDKKLIVSDMVEIYKTRQGFEFLYELNYYEERIDLLEKVIEYSRTPISEREEEQLYILCLPIYFDEDSRILNYESEDKTYFFDDIQETLVDKTKFTDKQISEMPIEIQKAIECGLLQKFIYE